MPFDCTTGYDTGTKFMSGTDEFALATISATELMEKDAILQFDKTF